MGMKKPSRQQQRNDNKHMNEIIENSFFGKANRPSTPVKGVLSNDYANEAERVICDRYQLVAQQRKANKKQQQHLFH